MKSLVFLFIVLCSLHANWKTERESYDNMYQAGVFRVFYTLKGNNALPLENRVDLNKNGIPDYIENIAQRLEVTREIYTKVLGFQDPLKSKRYKGAKYIDVQMANTKVSSAGDKVIIYNYKILKPRDKVLSLKIRNNLSRSTMTPSHEYFHLLQNSYTMFKNKWFTEGTARWSEKVFKKGTGQRGTLPQNKNELMALLNMSYDAMWFWRKLTYLCDTNNGIFDNKSINTEVIGYPKLIEDNKIYGYIFIRTFLENLDKEDNIASRDRNWGEFSWKESEQKYNMNNNVYILRALLKTMNQECAKMNDELITFTQLAKDYIEVNR